MNAKDAMIEEAQRVALVEEIIAKQAALTEATKRAAMLEEIIEKQAALIREYEDYVKMLKEMLQRTPS
jgi:cell fate (sporulation/competence/biofilm development) regulator YmcA (YheA/YmcA/DUF963 family)